MENGVHARLLEGGDFFVSDLEDFDPITTRSGGIDDGEHPVIVLPEDCSVVDTAADRFAGPFAQVQPTHAILDAHEREIFSVRESAERDEVRGRDGLETIAAERGIFPGVETGLPHVIALDEERAAVGCDGTVYDVAERGAFGGDRRVLQEIETVAEREERAVVAVVGVAAIAEMQKELLESGHDRPLCARRRALE